MRYALGSPHPLMLSLSKHTRFAGPKTDLQRLAFDKLRLSGEWK
mgnify:CR=1 FL=1